MEEIEALLDAYDAARASYQWEYDRWLDMDEKDCDQRLAALQAQGMSWSAAVDALRGEPRPAEIEEQMVSQRSLVNQLRQEMNNAQQRVTDYIKNDVVLRRIHQWRPVKTP
jgi:uncharacterized NAD(P)/FAD-binding protein YdhS